MKRTMRTIDWKFVALLAVVLPLLAYVLWITSRFVIAYQDVKHAHIFPKELHAQGWQEATNALSQDLPGLAPYDNFTANNSAYVEFETSSSSVDTSSTLQTGSTTPTLPEFIEETSSASAEPATSTSEQGAIPFILQGPPNFPPLFLATDTAPQFDTETTFASSSLATSTNSFATTTSSFEQADLLSTTTSSDPTLPVDVVPSTSTQSTSTVSTTTSMWSRFVPIVAEGIEGTLTFVKENLIQTAYAATSAVQQSIIGGIDTSTPALLPAASSSETEEFQIAGEQGPDESVSTCAIVGLPCHTLLFSDFSVSGSIQEKQFQNAQVNFSLAATMPDNTLSDGKLLVRYFHGGIWRTAGEVYINKELSNQSNGGYFSSSLEGISDWEDLDDIAIEVEFVRGDDRAAVSVYVDAVWIDVSFKDRIQDILSGQAGNDTVESRDNVTLSLREDHSNDHTLVLDDGSSIVFGYTDDLSDTLFIRSDKPSYKTGRDPDTEYVSVTNTGSQEDYFVLNAAFPEGKGAVRGFSQYFRNIATSTPRTVLHDIAYFCETGWQSQNEGYACERTGDLRRCDFVSDTRENCTVRNEKVVESQTTEYINDWVPVSFENLRAQDSITDGQLPENFRISAYSTKTIQILPGQTLYFKFSVDEPVSGPAKFMLLARGSYAGDLDSRALSSEAWALSQKANAAPLEDVHGVTRLSSENEFNGDELPQFKFAFKSKRSFLAKGFDRLMGRKTGVSVSNVKLERADGLEEDVPVAVSYGADGALDMQIKNQPRSFRPGKYSARIRMKDGSTEFEENVEFYWGVLVLNMDRSSYVPGEKANFMMGALDEIGNNICDAILRLSVVAPDGHAANVPVQNSPVCALNNVVEEADYSADYQTESVGVYTVTLTQFDRNGNAIHRISDSFNVEEKPAFVISRRGATRIYPVADYEMNIDVTSTSDFDGELIEPIPTDFLLADSGGADTRMYGSAKNLVWPLHLKAGETKRVKYVYDAPDISPYVYVLGPASVDAGDGVPFSEGRQWKLASDATGNMLLYWDQTYIPTGWTCVSCISTDPFYQRFVMGSSTPGLNGGAATHTHTATVTVTAATSSQGTTNNNQATPVLAHTHAGNTPSIASASNLPAYRQLAIIQYNSTGEPPSIPTGAIAIFDVASSSLPSGWYRYNKQDGQFIRAESTSTVGTTGGSNTHTHAISGTTGNAATTYNAANPGTSVTVAAANHTHTYSTTTPSTNSQPPYVEVVLARITATSTPPNTMIAMWSGSPTTGWTVLSSSSQVFDSRFIKASTTYGFLGGAATGTQSNMTGTFSSGPSITVARNTGATTNAATLNHSHLINISSFSIDDIEPPYRSAIIARRDGAPTPQPLVYIPPTPFDNEKSGTSTPYFEFTTTDPVTNEDLVYEFQYDDDSDLDTSPLADRLSSNETGCSPNCFQNITSPGNNSPFTEGERVRFSLQNLGATLNSGTTYFWRARAKEATASNWGTWSTTTSYTYVTGISPSEWFQTVDGQFDSDTLSGVETFGDDSVRTTVTPPSGVLVAYGEGTVQTPRYRLWDGASWSAESSAQDVGGTIMWIATAAGTTRDEYVLATQDTQNDINVQVYNGTSGTWGNLQEVTTSIASTTERGFDVAYETVSGRAMVVYCDGDADPSYYLWNGTSWTSGGTIDVSSPINCGWIKLASNPTSNEIIMVERNSDVRTNSYEAQVWNGSSWGSPKILGQMNEANHEGIAVQYEESGNQAVVVVSNNTAASFNWTAWDGSSWTGVTAHPFGNDFEWGKLIADVGSDALTLCYIDDSNDIGTLTWSGSAWATYVQATHRREANGNSKDGRAVDCAYETTAGRSHYIMLPYSDTTNGRYQYYNTTAWVPEASVSAIQDSWQIGAVRAGDGTIHAFFWDDFNTQYDVAEWNGSAWSTALSGTTTIETSSSATSTPYRQPIDLAAQRYEINTGTITSSNIDFTSVSSQSWGDISWRTTEPSGTSASVQVMYYTAGSCSTLIPDGDLPGNSTGFSAGASPLNISSLSTSTYSRICLKATLSTGNSSVPTLDEWGVSWQRNASLSQEHYRWYTNTDSTSPSDLWPAGASDTGEDTPIPSTVAPKPNDVLRLRISILASSTALTAGSKSFKLQYAEGTSCSASMTWQDIGAIGSTTAAWRGYNNATPSDGTTLSSTLITSADTPQSYEEENNSVANPNAIAVGDEGEWDWVLQDNTTEERSFCFRIVSQGGEVLNEYSAYPALITNSAPSAPDLSAPFDFEALASTTPWFYFASDDVQSDEISYQVQVNTDSTFVLSSVIDESSNSLTYVDDFVNISTPSDKDPFNPAQTVRLIPTSGVPLVNGTTYYWRVRAKDGSGSAEWGAWSDVYSFTVDTSVIVSTWRQTTLFQFAEDDHDLTEATSTNDVVLTPPNTVGTTTGQSISFSQKTVGNVWGALSWHQSTTTSSILYHIEYYNGTDWALIPDADLAGNAAGFTNSYLSLLGLSPTTYDIIRPQAVLTNAGATPRLQDWTVSWGTGVNEPTPITLFDNEKTATTTPTFTFTTTDPQSDDLEYEFSIGTLPDFTSSTTKNSVNNSGQFANVTTPSDTHPFTQGNTVSFSVISPNALTNGNTYWWRVRARDPSGGNAWSPWSEEQSFTVDTTVNVSTWFQTTNEQFNTDTLTDTEYNSNTARITSLIREAFVVYAESTVQVPRFRIWNGSSWGGELSAVTVNETIRFTEAAAAPTRDEYIIGTEGASGNIYMQVVDGMTDTAGNKVGMATTSDATQRGFDVAYETLSGDAIAVACTSSTGAYYRVWNGSTWSATSSIPLLIATPCEWVKLVSDPTSDEIIAVIRDATTGTTDFETYVWNGSTWGNTQIVGSKSTATNEGIAVEYEESGDQAVVVYGNGTANNFNYKTWNGSSWSATSTLAITNDFESGRLARDSGSDNMVLCYVDASLNLGIARWDGSTFNASQEFVTAGANASTGHPVACEFETSSGRDGYIMLPYSNTTQIAYTYWNGSIFSALTQISTMADSAEVRSTRTGDGNILVVSYNDADTQYDFSYWNGTSWSTAQNLNTNSIATVAPPTIPVDIVARRYPTFLTGSVESTDIDFADGSGVKWGAISISKTTPGSSSIAIQVEYYNSASSTWDLIPDSALSGNSVGSTTSPIDLSNLSYTTYANLRLKANLTCAGVNCPTLNDWTLTWSPGVTISGTAKQYDESTNVTSGTVAVAVNGVLQFGKTATISAGTWSIPNVRVFANDIVTVFVTGAADSNEAVAVTKYSGTGNITNMNLFERHLTLGSDDNPTITNANIGVYDYSSSGSEDLFDDVTAGNTLNVCATGLAGCFLSKLLVKSGTVYRPDSTSNGAVNARHIQIDGTIVADGNTFTVSGSWKNNYVFTKNTSTVIFSATSTAETIDSSTASSSIAFYNVTFGQTAGTSTWTLSSALAASSTITLNFGTLVRGANAILLSGDITIGSSGLFAPGTATTTFMGSGSNTWTDNSSARQYMGLVNIDGASKTVTLGSSVRATNITIGADDTLNAGGANTIDVIGNWLNTNTFTSQTGTVNFISTSTNKTITPGSSSFYNLTFNGSGGNWSFTTPMATSTNNFTITNGTVTLPTGTTTVGGNFDTFGGTFQHNNGTVLFNATASGKLIHLATSSTFYDLAFNGSGGGWSFSDLNATTSRSVAIAAGTATLPNGVLVVGGSFDKQGGTLSAGSGTLKFTATNSQTLRFGSNTSSNNITFNGAGATWAYQDTNATSTGTLRFENGTTTFPSGNLTIGASLIVTSGAFLNNLGTVNFNSSATSRSITPGNSIFYNLTLDSATGGWTITTSATSSNNFTLARASSFTLSPSQVLAVGNQFTNSVGGTATTWSSSILSLYSATSTTLNTKNNLGDQYETMRIGTSTKVKMWNSSATTTALVNTTGYLYSQNNASSTGSLYIYGGYTNSSNEYWSYATDFDGIALSGSARRQVNVRVASSSIITIGSNNFSLVGTSTASTTVANQGAGFYDFNITGGTVSANYYTIASTTPAGLSISGTPTITSLDFGEFMLSTPALGTSITIDRTVIDQNPALQILYTRFATSTGVLNGYNVTETGGAPTIGQYWWFKNGYGPFYGESYDNDPGPGGGNPGYVQFDDSGITATFTGHVYSDHGNTAMGNAVCETGTSSAKIVFRTSGGLSYSGTCDTSGAFSIPVTLIASNVVTAYLNTNGGPRGVTITKNVTGDVSNFDIYQNATIVRQADVTPTTIADMNYVDSTFDSDIPFTATSSLMVAPNTELVVWTGKLFAPGGDITLQSGGSGNPQDGRLYLATSSTFTAAGTPHFALGGGLHIDSTATFTTANSTFTFTATTTGKGIFSFTPITFYDVVFAGSGGEWRFNGTSTATTTMRTLTLTNGTVAGTGDIDVQTGGITGSGTINMAGGIFRLEGAGNFGNANPWQFRNLVFGSGSSNTITNVSTATTTVYGFLNVASGQTLQAGSSPWMLVGPGTPLRIGGTFTVQTAPIWYVATSSTNITATTYAGLFLAPTSSSPTYTMLSGTFTLGTTTIGDNTTALTVSATANDPTIDFTRDVSIQSNATFVAPDLAGIDITVEGSWINAGTFTPSGRTVTFDATSFGKTITPGASSFHNLTFNSASGGWTINGNATSTNNLTLSSVGNFTLSSGKSLEVGGSFTNAVASSTQTWTGSTLYLNSGTSYTVNSKSGGNATYGNLSVGANTKIRVWNSAQANTSVHSSGSLYAMNYASSTGKLYIWGTYTRSSGSDYWDYATDFDGISLGATSRKVDVYVASSSSLTFSGGLLDMIGATTASTTIQVQGSGAYAWSVSGGTFTAQYYEVRNTDPTGLSLSGSPTISTLANGDFLMASSSNSLITVAASVITANPLKVFRDVKFATTTGVVSGFNVTQTGTPSVGNYWKFSRHFGNLAGEQYDSDTGGDPGYIRWDNSNDHVAISGKVYSDEGTTVSTLCDSSTQVVYLKVAGAGSYTSSCDGTGLYSFPDVGFNPGDVLTLYIASSSKRSAIVSRGPGSNITDMDIYEHRVIVRHEDSTPLNIADMTTYDFDNDTYIPFNATDAVTDTLVVEAATKLIVWTGKTFAPAGNVTVASGGVDSYDGTVELFANSTFTSSGTQSHAFGGSFVVDSGATFTAANSTVTFTATTTGKTIAPSSSAFYNLVFNGTGGNWAFSGGYATSTNDFTITLGTVTMPTTELEVGGSFANTGGTFQHNNGLVKLVSTASGKTIQVNSSPFYNLIANGSGGGWTFSDTVATTSNNFTITNGSVTLPSTRLIVGASFVNNGTFTNNNGTVQMISTAGGKSVQAGGSSFYNLTFSGVGGGWTFLDTNATTSRNMTMATGTVILPTGTMAVGGDFNAASTTFNSNFGTVKFTATTTGFYIRVGTSTFYSLLFDSSAGGWTIATDATSTASTTITNASSWRLASGKSLEVDGAFTNSAGSATTWTGSTLYVNSGTSYSLNDKSNTGASYAQFTLGASTKVKMWNSSAATASPATGASLYSQDNANSDGALYIYGTYAPSSGTDYWSYATDFDGTALGGSSRQVHVRVATSSSVSYSGGTLNIVGSATASTTIFASGTTGYAFAVSGGTLNASYYQFKNLDSNGLSLSGSPVISSLSHGDFELSAASGTLITLAGATLDANANLEISTVKMASTSANIRGFNVLTTGTPGNFWTFSGAYGNVAGESFDGDGSTLCGHIRWDDSDCQFVNEAHYRWRNDDGGEGALSSTWYDNAWSKRQKLVISNPNGSSYTNLPVKVAVQYDSDMQSDFDDLRFTDSSGTTLTPFWRESSSASASSTVWVKVASLPASGSATLYMYYGNAGATSADDPDNVFSYFEGFESNSIAGFSGDNTPPTYFSTSASFNYTGSYGLAGNGTSGATPNGLYKTGSQTAVGKTIRWFQYVDKSSGDNSDEPCTYFAVQASPTAGDFAVCLDEFSPSPTIPKRVSIARDTHSRDLSGFVMASTSVTFSDQWYEVVVDWITGSPTNNINVNVYNPNGSLFASVSTTTSKYTTGGIGFGHFTQHGGWDDLMVKDYTVLTPSYRFASEQENNGATWRAAEDTRATEVLPNQNIRLRFSIQNTGTAVSTHQYRLQYAPKGAATSCEAVQSVDYNDVPKDSTGCGLHAACMKTSSQFTALASTSPSLSYSSSLAYTPGYMVQDPYNQGNVMALGHNVATEVEYNFQFTNNANQTAYCMRVINGATDLANYDKVAEAQLSFPPFISNLTLNNAQDITLTEATSTIIYASSTVTDYNGYADITYATSTLYRSGVSGAAACTADDNNCYKLASTSCALSNCSGNSCTMMCVSYIQFFADRTDASTYSADNWLTAMAVQDSSGLRDTQTSSGVEMLTLRALNIYSGTLDFGQLYNNSDTGTTDATSTITNTGNSPIDVQVSGTDLVPGAGTHIDVGQQKYATTTFAYGSCSICQFLSGSAASVNVSIPKTTATTSSSTSDIYFGLNVPTGVPSDAYSGTNTFTATAPPGG